LRTISRGCLGIAAVAATLFAVPALAQDVENSKDHPLLTRMPGYFIFQYSEQEFDQFEFTGKGGKSVTMEGKKTYVYYRNQDEAKHPSHVQCIKNVENALTRIGGKVVYEYIDSVGGQATVRLKRAGADVAVEVKSNDKGYNYWLTIVEKGEMKQDVVANADVWKNEINATGHAAVYGVYFDTDKSEVKPESEAALKEIAKLLQANPKLNFNVVGHSDATGDIAHNMKLSEARAVAVVNALVSNHGIAAARLKGWGVGPLAPVASNDAEEGRAKNRRVELVKR
jgi:OmpA-OmpF porin, OOP family